MSSASICNYSGSDWEFNSAGQNSCQMYEALQQQCNPTFTIAAVLPTDPAYPAPQTTCGCNLIAYNLMAGCGWCQNNIYSDWWLTYAEWQGNCTTATVTFSTTLPASVNSATLNLPVWVGLVPDLTTWDPAQASAAAVSATPSLTASTATATNPLNTAIASGGASSNNPFTLNTNSFFSYTGPFSGDDNNLSSNTRHPGRTAGIVVGILLAFYAVAAAIIIAVYFMRQKERKAWYGPMAQYYAAQRGGGAPQFYSPQAPYDPAKTPATTNSGSYGYQPPPPEATGYPGYDQQGFVQPHNTGFSNNTAYTGYQPPASTAPSTGAPYSIPSSGTPVNTASVYGAPPQGPPPGAAAGAGGMGYRGHAEV